MQSMELEGEEQKANADPSLADPTTWKTSCCTLAFPKRKCFSILAVVIVFAIMAIIIFIPKQNEGKAICEDGPAGCEEAWSSMLRNLNESLDPCDNFYRFACGNFQLDNGTYSLGNRQTLQIAQSIKLANMLDEPEGMDEIRPFILAKRFYSSCLHHWKMQKGLAVDDKIEVTGARIVCADEVERHMVTALAGLFSKRHLPEGIQTLTASNVLQMQQDIVAVIVRHFPELISSEDKDALDQALYKASSIPVCTLDINMLSNETDFYSVYDRVELNISDFAGNSELLKGLAQTAEKMEITLSCIDFSGRVSTKFIIATNKILTIDVNAFYNFGVNAIWIPLGMLATDLLSSTKPPFLKYATTGFLFGHEYGHGIDSVNLVRRENHLEYPYVRNAKASDPFFGSRWCLKSQYEAYHAHIATDLKADVEETMMENLADLIGTKLAYLAYEDWLSSNSEPEPEQQWPGLEHFTNRQLFWLSAANFRCGLGGFIGRKDQLGSGRYASPEFRTVGPFANMKEFAKDFNCPVGSPMNPKDKCL